MTQFMDWWHTLSTINQWFYMFAIFFGVLFLWQLAMAILGVGHGDVDLDAHVDAEWDHAHPNDAAESISAFKLVSVRSILAFLTLFSWAGALYLNQGKSVTSALPLATLWGTLAMIFVAGLLHVLIRLTETGNVTITSAVGKSGTVYLDIPAGGLGEIRTLCDGVSTHLKARNRDGAALPAGTAVRILQIIEGNTVIVADNQLDAPGNKS